MRFRGLTYECVQKIADEAIFWYDLTMLTPDQEKYLSKFSDYEMITVVPWEPRGLDIAQAVIDEIKSVTLDLEIIFIGSLPLRIAGQRDVDLSVLSPAKDFPIHQAKLEKKFGRPDVSNPTSIGWHFMRDDYGVSVYLTDPVTSQVREQIDVFNLLKNHQNLLKEYEQIKLNSADKPYKEYQRRKYEFFNRILGKGQSIQHQ